ncbi:Mus81p [Sporobolomyces salmoneus]|uniref:Mus81p n=1 Tax=Sporobolomyces salmoneus TaxID=183962 RepID=UPI003181CBEB
MPPKAQPGNPDWVEWIETYAESLEEKGLKSAQPFKKAARNLRANPVTYVNPEQATVVEGVGPATVKFIRKKMEERAKAGGLPMPDRILPSLTKRRAPAGTSTAASKKRAKEQEEAEQDAIREARRQKTMGIVPGSVTPALGFQAHPDGAFRDLPAEDDEEVGTWTGKGKGKAKARTEREYIPKKNSGGYALLISLYMNSSYDERHRALKKDEIIADAKGFSATSFDTTSANRDGQRREGSGFTYSAWSNMSTLMSKDLVATQQVRPARFYLTDKGYSLAERLAEDAGVPKHVYVPSSSPGHAQNGGPPSSSGLARHPSSSGGLNGLPPSSDGARSASFSGRGQTLGGRPASIHANVFRPRAATPINFLDEPGPSRIRNDDDEEMQLEEDTRRAIEMSMRESREDPVARIAREAAARGGSGIGSSSSAEGGGGASVSRSAISSAAARRIASGAFSAPISSEPVPSPSIANIDKAFGYFYLDENDRRTRLRSEAEVSQPEGSEMWYRIEYRTAQDLHAMARGLWNKATLTRTVPLRPINKTKSAYIKERVSTETAPGFPESELSATTTNGANSAREKEKRPSDDPVAALLAGFKEPTRRQTKEAMYLPPPQVRRLGAAVDPFEAVNHALPLPLKHPKPAASTHDPIPAPSRSSSSSHSQPIAGPSRARASPPPLASRHTSATPLERTTSSASAILACVSDDPLALTTTKKPLQACYDPLPTHPNIPRHPLDPARDPDPTIPSSFPSFQPITWPAGSFKVYLIVDTRERKRESKGHRIEVSELLKRGGMRADGKMLPLGDMIWVARKVDPRTGQALSREQDVVLDAIVERKTWEDLTASIKDGRYHDQKVRLKDSGITERIYMIEKHGDLIADSSLAKAHKTCKSELQVIDGFFVHESANLDDTMNYLKKRTQIMAEIYENNDLRIIPDHVIDRRTYLSLQHHLRSTQPAHRYLTTYSTFAGLNDTDSMLTSRVQWASMVLRIHGMSEEKAVKFVDRWETLAQFYEEAKVWEQEIEEENRKLDQLEREGKGPTGRGKPKRRTKQDFVTSNLVSAGTREIKGALGAKVWDLIMNDEGKYPN